MADADAWAAEMERDLAGLCPQEQAVRMQQMQEQLYAKMAAEEKQKSEKAAADRAVSDPGTIYHDNSGLIRRKRTRAKLQATQRSSSRIFRLPKSTIRRQSP